MRRRLCGVPPAGATFDRLLDVVLDPHRPRPRTGGTIPIARRAAPSLQILVTPTDTSRRSPLTPGTVATVFVLDPTRHERVCAEALPNLFGLTPAQAALAVALAEGRTLADVAHETGLALSTVRERAKQLFARTGTRRQAELVALVLRSPAALTGPIAALEVR